MNVTILILTTIVFPVFAMSSEPISSRMLNEKPLTKKQATERCLKLDLGTSKLDCTECKVVSIQNLADFDGQKLSLARYEYSWSKDSGLKECGYGTVVMKETSSKLEPIWGGFGSAKSSEEPKIFQLNGASFVSIPVRYSGTAAAQNDGLLSFRNGQWHEVDTQTYQADLKKRIPAGLSIEKGLYPDYRKMTVESGLWKKSDPNCCASGGQFTAKLSVENDRLVITDYKQNIAK